MAYNWGQLAFVEKWRLRAIRGPIVGMHRPADKTYFDLRLRPGEGNATGISATVDLHLLDAGDIIREKRIPFLHHATVVVRIVGRPARPEPQAAPLPRRPLEAGATLSGTLVSLEDDEGLVDLGFPVVVQFEEPPEGLSAGDAITISVTEIPKGFLVV